MNIIDIIIIGLLLISGFNGFRQGLINALANLVGWLLALILAIRWTDRVQPLMSMFSTDIMIQKIAAFVAIIMVVVGLTWIAGYLLQNVFKHLKLSWLNRLAGSAFGLGKSLVVVLIFLYGAMPWFAETKTWKGSSAIHLLAPFSHSTLQYSQQIVQKTAEEFRHYQSDENNTSQDDIIRHSTSESKKTQVENPFL